MSVSSRVLVGVVALVAASTPLAASATPAATPSGVDGGGVVAGSDGEAGGVGAGRVIPGHWIVRLESGVDADEVAREYRSLGGGVRHVYRAAVRGFAGPMPPAVVRRLLDDPRVALVEPDREVTGVGDAPWGLDRIDQRTLPLSGTFDPPGDGSGVTAYVLDTGVRSTHEDFGGRVLAGHDAVGGSTTEDCNGHGTHIAGTIAGATFGVARAATIVPVRVLRCDLTGSWSDVIEGIDWVTAHHEEGEPAVANLSIGGATSSSADAALRAMIADGVVAAVAAGNQSSDACDYSPARVGEAVTVAATGTSDQRRPTSNAGPCVDLFAPGSGIHSTLHTSDTATGYRSGTSMAAPHAAGAAAVLLGLDPGATPTTIATRLRERATSGVVLDAGSGSPNLLLHVAADGDRPPAPDGPPVVELQWSCEGLTCTFDASASHDPDGGDLRFSWTLGDGAVATGSVVGHTYAADGSYDITLTVTDDEGESTARTTTVTAATVDPDPEPEPDPDPSPDPDADGPKGKKPDKGSGKGGGKDGGDKPGNGKGRRG